MGESLDVADKIKRVIDANTHLKGTFNESAIMAHKLTEATQGYSTEALKMAISQSTVNKECIKAMLAQSGLEGEVLETTVAELSQVTTTNALSVSQVGTTATTANLTTAFKGLGSSIKSTTTAMWTFLTTNPIGWAILAVGSIASVIAIYNTVHDLVNVSLEEQKEKTEELQREYNELTSKISDINKELQTTQDRIAELNKQDTLTFTEEDELKRLQTLNDELKTQNLLLKDQARLKQNEVAQSVKKEYEKDNSNKIDRSWLPETNDEDYAKIQELDKEILKINNDIILGNYASEEEYDKLEERANALKVERDILAAKNGVDIVSDYVDDEQFIALATEKYRNLYAKYVQNPEAFFDENGNETDDKKLMDEIHKSLVDKATSLNDYIERYGVEDEWSQHLKDMSLEISYTLYPGEFKSELFDREYNKLLPTAQKEIEKMTGRNELTTETLIDVIPEESINTLSKYGISLEDIVEKLYDMADASNDASNYTENFVDTLSRVHGLNEGLNVLTDIYTDVKDGGNFDYSSMHNNDDFKKSFSNYSSEYENFVKTISEFPNDINKCQSAFNDLATAYIYGSGVMDTLTNDTKNQTIAMLEQMGVSNATALVEEQLIANEEELSLRKQFLSKYGYDLKYATDAETLAFLNEVNATESARYALFNYQLEEQIFNDSTLDVSGRIEKLVNLATAYGVCSDIVNDFNNKQALQEQGISIGTNYTQADLDDYISRIRGEISASLSSASVDFTGDSLINDAETDYADLLKKETTLLEKQLEAGIITFKDYTDKRKSIIEDYYRQGLISAEDYYSALEDMYDYQLSLYDKVIDAVNYRIDKEIDALEKEKESIEDTYNLKIKLIQTEIDELEKAREKREQQVELEKALYEVEKARSQRDVKLYSGSDRGVIYTNDNKELREVEENLENEKYESHISKLEEQIESLEGKMKKATDTIDEQINTLSDYADKWSDVADEYEHAQNDMLAFQILGANYEEEILNQRMATLEIFKNNYIAAQNAMAEANRKVYETQVNNKQDEVVEPAKPKHYNTRYKVVVDGKTMADYGNSYTAKVWMKNNAPSGTIVPYQVPVYAKGGVIGTKKSPLDSIAQSLGEDHLVAGKEGERFLTPVQNEMWEKWTEALPNLQNFANMLQYNIPNYNFDNMVLRSSRPVTNISFGDIHVHEVNDGDSFAKSLNKYLPGVYLQHR